MAKATTETDNQDEAQPEPAATGDTTHVHEYKLMVDKAGKPTPSLKSPLANHKCTYEGCDVKVWIP